MGVLRSSKWSHGEKCGKNIVKTLQKVDPYFAPYGVKIRAKTCSKLLKTTEWKIVVKPANPLFSRICRFLIGHNFL